MNYKKKTSTRGAGKGRKLSSGTRDQLITDLQRVHKLFPTATPDRDFYRQHGKYPDAAWKEHFSRFKDFVAAAGGSPAASVCWHLNQAFKLLQQEFTKQEARDIDTAFTKVYSVLPSTLDEESQRRVMEVLALMEEEEINHGARGSEMTHDCEYNIDVNKPHDFTPCGKPAVAWVNDGSKFDLCAEHYDIVVAAHPDVDKFCKNFEAQASIAANNWSA